MFVSAVSRRCLEDLDQQPLSPLSSATVIAADLLTYAILSSSQNAARVTNRSSTDLYRADERNDKLKSIVTLAENEAQSLESRPLLLQIARAPQAATEINVGH